MNADQIGICLSHLHKKSASVCVHADMDAHHAGICTSHLHKKSVSVSVHADKHWRSNTTAPCQLSSGRVMEVFKSKANRLFICDRVSLIVTLLLKNWNLYSCFCCMRYTGPPQCLAARWIFQPNCLIILAHALSFGALRQFPPVVVKFRDRPMLTTNYFRTSRSYCRVFDTCFCLFAEFNHVVFIH